MEQKIDEVLAEVAPATEALGTEDVVEGVEALVTGVPEADEKERPVIVVTVDGEEAIIDLLTLVRSHPLSTALARGDAADGALAPLPSQTTSCDSNPPLAQKVHSVLAVAIATTTPLFLAGVVDGLAQDADPETESLYGNAPEAKMEEDADVGAEAAAAAKVEVGDDAGASG